MRFFALILLAAPLTLPLHAGILPGVVGPWKQVSTAPLPPAAADSALWSEYGLQDSEQGVYANGASKLAVQAWRVADSTAAMAAFEFLRPPAAAILPKFDELTPTAVSVPDGALVAVGNYVVRFQGGRPDAEAVANMMRAMPRYEHGGLPTFPGYLPRNAVSGSERYVGGPVALQRFFPGVAPAQAGFHLGAEAAVADYPSGLKLALFSFPTPAIARDREAELQKIPNAVVKRSGPLVAVVLQPKDGNAAEALLAQVRYQAVATTGEKPPSAKDNPGNLLLNVFFLIGILAALCVASGLVFGLIRVAFRRGGADGEGEEVLSLHLEGR